MADRRPDRRPDCTRVLMGFGLDGDGHARVTKGDDFVLLGGSEHTHEHMQDGVQKLHDTLRKMGTDFQSASGDEVAEAAYESGLRD